MAEEEQKRTMRDGVVLPPLPPARPQQRPGDFHCSWSFPAPKNLRLQGQGKFTIPDPFSVAEFSKWTLAMKAKLMWMAKNPLLPGVKAEVHKLLKLLDRMSEAIEASSPGIRQIQTVGSVPVDDFPWFARLCA